MQNHEIDNNDEILLSFGNVYGNNEISCQGPVRLGPACNIVTEDPLRHLQGIQD